MKARKVRIETLGCKLNRAETDILAEHFLRSGYCLTSSVVDADVYILNTCTVTHIADRKSRHLLRAAHRSNANAFVVATGCYTQYKGRELAAIDGVDMVVGNDEKMNILTLIESKGYSVNKNDSKRELRLGKINPFKNRAFIKVQDGCNNFCAYCIVPLVRGPEKSIPAGEIIARIKEKVIHGYKEVVLTGTEIGSYHDKGITLIGLVKKILDETMIERLRLSSLQPKHITPQFIELWKNRRLCPQLHLPLQSGSEKVLRRMKRSYSIKDYDKAICLIRKIPDVAITTDVIVGFPGESTSEFEESFNYYKIKNFARIHVFPFSLRSGTKATEMNGQINANIKKQRSKLMIKLAEKSAKKFRERFMGEIRHVLWEKKSNGIWSGLTSNYIRVYAKNYKNLTNKITRIKLEKLYKDGVWGI
ncbi:MAG: tRNA (N(6)-L-threonylcarbamoyladenosine(37)-C(2))-methylthiotransferase MtaB [Dehalococcoidia bacterium]|nr:MAG: tRNA (N(6)-L-threonylcarbamoyladenosine(37)-C(2))-methylthiotransferase MtaB [Dehalococcoidia bacterium]